MMPISPSSRHHQLINTLTTADLRQTPGAWRTVIVAGNIAQKLISVLGLGRCEFSDE